MPVDDSPLGQPFDLPVDPSFPSYFSFSLPSDLPIAYKVRIARVNEYIHAVLQEGHQLALHVLHVGSKEEGGEGGRAVREVKSM